MTNNMNDLYELTRKFNDISGSSKELSLKSMKEQFLYVDEEVNEIREALDNNDLVELLDGCIDTVITVYGMLQKLENLGVDIGQAAIDTAINNNSKYPTSPSVAHATVDKLLMKDGTIAKAVFNESENCYVIRDVTTGKVKKPDNFLSNDLTKYITTEVKENYQNANN